MHPTVQSDQFCFYLECVQPVGLFRFKVCTVRPFFLLTKACTSKPVLFMFRVCTSTPVLFLLRVCTSTPVLFLFSMCTMYLFYFCLECVQFTCFVSI